MPLTVFRLDEKGELSQGLSREDITRQPPAAGSLLWLDIEQITDDDAALLRDVFGLHPLAIEDCQSNVSHRPKIEDFGQYLFLIAHGVDYTATSHLVETAELCIFIGEHFLVTSHHRPLHALDYLKGVLAEGGKQLMQRGSIYLAYDVLDKMVDNFLPLVEKMNESADLIEDVTLENPSQSVLQAILKLKQSTLKVNRIVIPQREVMSRLSRREFGLASAPEMQVYFRDIYDHIIRIEDLNMTLRERADNLLNTYLSAVANRQNEVMKILSIVAAIFLPLTLLAGIYGMNFQHMPELAVPWAYYAVLGFMALVIFGALGWFRARGIIRFRTAPFLHHTLFIVEPTRLLWGKLTKRKP